MSLNLFGYARFASIYCVSMGEIGFTLLRLRLTLRFD